ncbi:MAG: hypothetical protein H0T51_12670 [Pirellulales bacterium]|nr:hypothetical protein [Pirellulales bacterium]
MRIKLNRFLAACGFVVAVAAALPSAQAQSAAEMKPLAEVVFSGYDELMKDVDFIGSLSGQPQASQMIDQTLQMFTQNKGLAGLDKSKPIGVIVQTDGTMPAGAVCVPVTDLNALLDVVKGFGVTAADAGNGLQQLSTPQGQNLFVKDANGWALISMAPAMLESIPADPAAVLSKLAAEYDLAFRVHMQNMPESYRQQAIDAMSQGAQQGLSQNADESDEDFKVREEQVAAQLEQLKQFINELDQFTFGLSVDGEQQRAFIDFAYTAIPGTKLAADVAANSSVTTNFAGFIQPDAAATLTFASKMNAADASQLDQMIESLRTQAAKAVDDDDELKKDEAKAQVKAGVNEFIDALKATLQAGTIDGGASLDMGPDALTFVAGGFVADPAKIESGLKKIVEAAKTEKPQDIEKAGIKWSAEKHKDVTFHTASAPIEGDGDDEENARKLFGDKVDLVVGIGGKAVYFAMGRDALATVKKVIDDSAAAPAKATVPMEMTVALGQIMNAAQGFADEDDKPQIEMIANMLANEAEGRDHVRINAQPIENGVRVRFEAEEGVLRAIGMGAMQAQMHGAAN